MHSVWSKMTNERLAALGLNFLTGYVWGRAAALGEPEPGVVVSSFAVFQPDLVHATYTAGRAAVERDVMLAARADATITSLTSTLGDPDVTSVAEALRNAVTAMSGIGRPLFSGLRDQPWPTSPIGVLWRACELAREHRGDGHIAVCVADGLDPVSMNVLTELFVGMPLGTYSASRGWSADQIADAAADLAAADLVIDGELTASGLDYRRDIEARTDALDEPLIDGLATVADVDGVIGQLADWSQRCVDAGAFPPDPFKRAAG